MINYIKNSGRDIASLTLRIGFGFFIAFGHGLAKLLILIGDEDVMFVSFFGLAPEIYLFLAICAEFIGGIALILGFKTRIASFVLISTMMVAIFGVHLNDPLFSTYAQDHQSMEFAFIYLIGFSSIYFLNGGIYSIDHLLEKKK